MHPHRNDAWLRRSQIQYAIGNHTRRVAVASGKRGNVVAIVALVDRERASGDVDSAAKAVVGYEKAFRIDNPARILKLGLCFIEGYGIQVDLQRGVELVNRAANMDPAIIPTIGTGLFCSIN